MFKWPSWRRWKMLIDRYTKAVLVVYPFQDAFLSHLLQQKHTYDSHIELEVVFDWQCAFGGSFWLFQRPPARQAARDIMKQAKKLEPFIGSLIHPPKMGCFPKMVGKLPPNHPMFNRVFHYKSSILGYPYFGKHPYLKRSFMLFQFHAWQMLRFVQIESLRIHWYGRSRRQKDRQAGGAGKQAGRQIGT